MIARLVSSGTEVTHNTIQYIWCVNLCDSLSIQHLNDLFTHEEILRIILTRAYIIVGIKVAIPLKNLVKMVKNIIPMLLLNALHKY